MMWVCLNHDARDCLSNDRIWSYDDHNKMILWVILRSWLNYLMVITDDKNDELSMIEW